MLHHGDLHEPRLPRARRELPSQRPQHPVLCPCHCVLLLGVYLSPCSHHPFGLLITGCRGRACVRDTERCMCNGTSVCFSRVTSCHLRSPSWKPGRVERAGGFLAHSSQPSEERDKQALSGRRMLPWHPVAPLMARVSGSPLILQQRKLRRVQGAPCATQDQPNQNSWLSQCAASQWWGLVSAGAGA